jgi:hypothetical protein
MGKIILTSAAILFTTYATSYGASLSGNDWVKKCNAKETYEILSCAFYARGIADGLKLWEVNALASATACVETGVSTAQLIDVGKAFIRDNPKDRHLPAGVLLAMAFRDAWPCRK